MGVPCPASPADPSVFACALVVPGDAKGPQRLRARATGADGRSTTLSAAIPVVIETAGPWQTVDALNVRMTSAFFAADSAVLDDAAKAALAGNLDRLKEHPDLPILLEGRCDAGEKGDRAKLSRRRAEAARDHLVGLGIPGERIRLAGLSDGDPLTASRDEAERAVNRSVLVRLLPAGTAP